jgi:NTE family protein
MAVLRPRRSRTAFVLSGGGNLGAIQVGQLKALTEHGIVPDLVLGCSVGALNGAAYARAPTRAGVRRLEDLWQDVESPTLMPSSRIPSAVQLLRRGASLHDNAGLRHTIDTMLGGRERFEDLALRFQCVATDVETAMERWFTEGELVPAILASAALPAVYPPVEIGSHRYLDGGVVDNVPIARAVELGCTLVYVLHMGPHGRPDADIRRPLDGALMAYWLARNSRFARDLAALPAGVDAVVLPPGRRPDLRYDDFSQTAMLVEQGYENTLRFLDERAEELEARRQRTLRGRLARMRLPTGREAPRTAEDAAVDPAGAIVSAPPDRDGDTGDSGDAVAGGRGGA